MSCASGCYEAQVNGCGDITLAGGVDPETAYYIQISKSGNGNVYQRQVYSGTNGNLMILKENYPAGYFTPGYFNLKVRKASDYSIQPLTLNGNTYTCVVFQIVNTNVSDDDISPIDTIK